MKRVLVTGCSGRVGRATVLGLKAAKHFVRGLDVRPNPNVDEFVQNDLQKLEGIQNTAQDMDVIIHLAASPDDKCWPPDAGQGDNFLAELVPNNIIALYNILEAARLAAVPRIVLASSGQVVWDQTFDGPFPLDANTPPTPRYWYAAAKLFMEAIGRSYAINHQTEVLAIRLGWCPRDIGQEQEIASMDRHQDVYLSPRDVARFMNCCVEAKSSPERFQILYAASKPPFTIRFDLETAEKAISFVPKDAWPEGLEFGK